MPPKRLRRHSPSTSGAAVGERLKRAKLARNDYSAWGWVGSEVTDASEISERHRLASCGFLANNNLALCPNKYSIISASIPNSHKRPETVGEGELQDDIIIISDDEGPSCSIKMCKNSPYCLNYLGQDNWEDEDKARDAFLKRARLGDNPIYLARDPGSPIGLRNLGATCYANAFLQVWFQDRTFRSGVYRCLPPQESGQKFEESPIFQLQVTFAAMQESTQNVFNPVKLVESLRLRTTEQQDAQEFSKLFMAHLDSEFQKQSSPELKSLLADQFQGKQAYGTLCSNCHNKSERESEFLEVEVNIPKNNANLEERLLALLQPEELSGDNKYFCSVCNELQDAKRYTEFKEFPPVLHISLLRFIFDLQSMERKKTKNAISFPMTLDMNTFLGVRDTSESEREIGLSASNLYRLRGVLLHKGSSAYHGHYEAQVFDVQNKSWYQFNDETVTRIDSLVSVPKPNTPKERLTAQRGRSRRKTRIDDSDVEIIETPTPRSEIELPEQGYVSSRDAYMLVYARESSPFSTPNGRLSPKPEPEVVMPFELSPVVAPVPQRALEVVNNMNADHDHACDDYLQKEKLVMQKFEDKRRVVMDIYRTWSLSSLVEDSSVVSQQALELWLGRHVAKSQKKPGRDSVELSLLTTTEDGAICNISNADIICKHNRLDPHKSLDMKRIRKVAVQRILEEDQCSFLPALSPMDVCEECTADIFKERMYQIQHPQIVSRFDAVCQADDDELSYWISKPWLKDWRLQKPKMHEPAQLDPPPDAPDYTGHVVCEHAGLTTNTTTRKRISQEGYHILREIFPEWQPLSSDIEVCPVCEALLHISKADKREVRKQAEDEKAKLKHMHDMSILASSAPIENEPCTIIPVHFLKSWKQWLFRPAEIQRPQGIDNTRFICRHGNLLIDPNVSADLEGQVVFVRQKDYDVLENLYPCGPLISVESNGDVITSALPVCGECHAERQSKFDTTEITIRVLKASDSLPTPETFSTHTPVVPPLTKSPFPITYGSRKINGVRQSKRIRQADGHNKRRKVTITKEMTVKELKVKLQDELSIPTIYQRLFHRGQEVEDNSVTLISFGVIAHDVLDLRAEPEDVDLIGSGDENVHRNRSDEGRAFGGTLLGGDRRAKESFSSNIESPEPMEKSCPACTFVNSLEVVACTMCDTVFYTDS